jgi:hypothetical protein
MFTVGRRRENNNQICTQTKKLYQKKCGHATGYSNTVCIMIDIACHDSNVSPGLQNVNVILSS